MQGRLPSRFIKAREEHRRSPAFFPACPFGRCLACSVGTTYELLPPPVRQSGRVASQVVADSQHPHVRFYCFTPGGSARTDSLWNHRLLSCPFAQTPESFLLSILLSLTSHFLDLDGVSLTVPESNGPDKGPFLMRVVPTFLHWGWSQLLSASRFFF